MFIVLFVVVAKLVHIQTQVVDDSSEQLLLLFSLRGKCKRPKINILNWGLRFLFILRFMIAVISFHTL